MATLGEEARLRRKAEVLDQAGQAIITTDLEGIILTWNRAAQETYGWSEEEAVGQDIYYLLPAALPDDDIETMMATFRGGGRWAGELVLRRKDGEWVSSYHFDAPLFDGDKVVGIVSVSHSLGERRAVEAASRQQVVTKQLVRAMLQSLGQGDNGGGLKMRHLGRDLARKANCPDLSVFVTAFSNMGLGELSVETAAPPRFVLAGSNLLESRAGATQPTCQLPLGFLEGAIEALHGGVALGAETRCQSMGHPRCTFVVQRRESVVK